MYHGTKVIDVHGHLSTPPEFHAFAYNLQLGLGMRRVGAGSGLKLPEDAMASAQARHLKLLDDRAIDVQFISPRPYSMMHFERPAVVEAWTRATNEVIHQACTLHPGRFAGVAQLPQHTTLNTSNCIAELDRCILEWGFVGAIVNPDPGSERQTPGMDTEYWYPLYQRAAELKATLVVHGSATRDPRTYDNQVNFLTEQTLATLLLERSDVFDRFPDLKILVVHCGGALTRFVTNSISAAPLPTGGLPAGLFFDTCAYDKDYLALAFKQRGLARMCFGTETPGSGTAVNNPETGRPSDDLVPVIDSMSMLSEQDKLDIFHHRPKRVFPLFRGS